MHGQQNIKKKKISALFLAAKNANFPNHHIPRVSSTLLSGT